jgi:hypothetical protein
MKGNNPKIKQISPLKRSGMADVSARKIDIKDEMIRKNALKSRTKPVNFMITSVLIIC